MNGPDDVQTGPEPATPGDSASTMGTMQDAPPGAGTATEAQRPFRTSRATGLWGFTIPEPVQRALAPAEGLGKQYVAWIGCALLFIGLFVSAKTYTFNGPIVSVTATRSLWDYGTFWAVILLLLVLASAGIAYIRDYKWLLVAGGVSLLILLLNFLFAFSGEAGFSAHPSWGWILLFPGALILIAAGAMRPTPRDAMNDNGLTNVISSFQSRGTQ
jgi:hypothetical protein